MSKKFSQNFKKQPAKHVLKGSREAVIYSMQMLYSLGYGSIAEWTPLEPTDVPGEVMTTITKYWLLP
ncbi:MULTISPECIES: hypothetical protein [Moorena]|uniref:Uncharacterized protein n=1 Tax=Moorena producens 3L TaxID=489825 RepID=F4XU40_9CYAN|nr:MULTISPECIES: hypothetical protein [Moorena]EGJ32016.1 hypothetical protein LYNGBM3L_31820 [Moorena producens 3L]NEP33797.1 hypothetical protein [Moorena sp. SIO3B2]NEP64707.1 hypothetical protein [Moorena sp. SIO3A5]NEQ07273.1 hypothetical protein [Moorena sp. SIO4E2]NER85796.1 hypothetical protein [Moorena sp. SIO3A2]